MRGILLYFFLIIFSIQDSYSQKEFENTRAYFISKGLKLSSEEKEMFKETMSMEKDISTWLVQRTNLKNRVKELNETLKNPNISVNEKKIKELKLKEITDDLNNKSYDINEYYELINETRKKIYFEYLNSKKLKELSSTDYKFVQKLISDSKSFFNKAEIIRKRAYKEIDFQMTCLTLNNASDFEIMGIKILEKAVMFVYKIEPEQISSEK